ncbi:TM2 domain-containing protein [Zhouia sp. PK063]|uniref:TM2 domain-containing protein n=1 Tax=Zhouia sp. PK063 TaxID=3373602 RepID=UPI0037B4C086
MKFKIIFTLLFFALTTSLTYASFPVKRVHTENTASTTVGAQNNTGTTLMSPAAMAGAKSQGVALLLLVFLGWAAAHRWYLGSPWYWNVLFIITLGGLGIWAIVDLIDICTGNYPAKGGFKSSFF